ncbi:MAG: tRNA 2-thiouridine(34) synthase MnmA [Oscillospiraceae bacterium]|nr:tRNA 2-thiouridine(34) synthase MnmA [Oscillospiraceae bacterium]
MEENNRALIAMSGGVDSSVAAYLTMEQGYDCLGCTMKLFQGERGGSCCSLEDVEDARAVARRLGMPYYVFNFSDRFQEAVMEPFVRSYQRGRTPNPCIECNRRLKFDCLLERAIVLGCGKLVTGHYARVQREGNRYVLKKALNPDKDQSYVLYMLTQAQLAHILFPLGGLDKEQVRRLAGEQGFLNAQKPDSQDICFVPDGDVGNFIQRYTGAPLPPGDFIDSQGRVLGRHRGLARYTIGQRRGLGVSLGERRYVCALNPEANTVTLGDNRELFRRGLWVGDFNWISGAPPGDSFSCAAKIRYRQPEQPAQAAVREDGTVAVTFQRPQRAVTPGQAVVLYDGDTVLGGGVIEGDIP